MEKGPSTGNFERWMKGALGLELLSLKKICGRGLRGGEGAPSLGTLEDILRKALDTVISLSLYRGAPLQTRGTWSLEEGLIHRGLRKEGSRNGVSICEGFH